MIDLGDLHGIHSGEVGYIVGNGPSIREMPLERINHLRFVSFGMNSIARHFEATTWRPTYYVAVTSALYNLHYQRWIVRAIEQSGLSFIGGPTFDDVPAPQISIKTTHGEAHWQAEDIQPEWWSDDPREGVCKFGTSTLVCLQLAVWMGLNPIYLVGMDLSFEPHTQRGADPNHFDPNYNPPQPGMDWERHTRDHIAAHTIARINAMRHGVRIYNAGLGGELEVYPRMPFPT